jgi:hypothetical protein
MWAALIDIFYVSFPKALYKYAVYIQSAARVMRSVLSRPQRSVIRSL